MPLKKIFFISLLLWPAIFFTSCATLPFFKTKPTVEPVDDLSKLFVEEKNSATGQTEIIIPVMNNGYPVRMYLTKGFLNPYKLFLEVTYQGDVWVYTNKVKFSSGRKSESFGLGKCEITTNKDGSVKEVYTLSLSDTQASDLYYLLLKDKIKVSCQGKHYTTKKIKVENIDAMIYTIKYYIMISNASLKD